METIFIIIYWMWALFTVIGLFLLGYEFIRVWVAKHKEE